MTTSAQMLYEETGDARWLDPAYARKMVGPAMASKWAAARRTQKAQAALLLRRQDPLFVYLKRMACSGRKNASRKGLPFELSDDQIWALLERSGRRCEVTRVPFCLDKHAAGRAPLAPSMDRIDDRLGYSQGNVRLVCQIANLAMNVWDSETLIDFIRKASA